ncbi:pseudouridine-5'-phosphate glycosidase [Chromobacterium sp. Beijing]|uniref:pseudouridine-5'-phosphate glycosidase n=1 Tax=Chromobacterium sp. Beijing TaxID=2735795 RepID=UPI001F38AD74|nr:pseudouridine-5'-phosphate glycosidase [Chromobacterium sp. Beijing]UJB30876.1 pseudouridine-5'-phosphate glycosidase [Chromobacterium sp. Beijing]
MHNAHLDIHPEVAAALAANRPVVALESTIISHGMPYPQNVETALQVEAEIRAHGAVPATIAIIDGRLKAGLSADEIEYLGKGGRDIAKVSRRDLPFIVAGKRSGATTVATTMIIAAMAGIRVFATGGIGGVHRGAERSFDVSADLQELAQTPVAVVCAGAKSILDLGLTLEYLETHGVPVIGHRCDHLPAFFTRDSAFKLDHRLDEAVDIAATMQAKWNLQLRGGVVVANPIPEQYAMPRDKIDAAIEQALGEAEEQGVAGKESTPFLLARVCELTGGNSLAANIQLVLNNARLASAIAARYCELNAG